MLPTLSEINAQSSSLRTHLDIEICGIAKHSLNSFGLGLHVHFLDLSGLQELLVIDGDGLISQCGRERSSRSLEGLTSQGRCGAHGGI